MTDIKENISLAPYTLYKIGGPARYFVEVKSADELREALQYAAEKRVPFFIMGAGSNVLIADKGYDGMVIRMTGGEARAQGERLIADAGVMMARAAGEAARAGLAGFEWGIGVPGTIGGSVRGNAGCFGGEMKDVVESVDVFDASSAARRRLAADECAFGYRDSIFKQHPEWVIVSATLRLKTGNPATIQNEVKRIMTERSAKQDIGTKSCGCIFKNPPWQKRAEEKEKLLREHPEFVRFAEHTNIPASFLIDRASLKGICVGRACISERHANFFVNQGGATAADVRSLVALVKEKARSLFGVALEEEIQCVGF